MYSKLNSSTSPTLNLLLLFCSILVSSSFIHLVVTKIINLGVKLTFFSFAFIYT